MKRTFTLNHVLFLLAAALPAGCASPEKLLETGNYDQAIEVSLDRLAGRKQKKEEYVRAVEAAFHKATSRDMAYADRLKVAGPQNWEKVYDLYRNIRLRQERIEPFLPLVDRHGIKADFRFVRTAELEAEAAREAAAYFYDLAGREMEAADQGDRLAARSAYRYLQRIERFFPDYRDQAQLKRTAREMGTTFVLVEVGNDLPIPLPVELEQELLEAVQPASDDPWKVFHIHPRSNLEYDYKVQIRLTDLLVSPEQVRERRYREEREIEDGFEYVLDENGNVAKDSLGNDIKLPRTVVVAARILESYQNKAAKVLGLMEIYDLASGDLLESERLEADAVFDHYAATFRGDERALSEESRRLIGSRPLPFPSDLDLVRDASLGLKPLIRRNLKRTNVLI